MGGERRCQLLTRGGAAGGVPGFGGLSSWIAQHWWVKDLRGRGPITLLAEGGGKRLKKSRRYKETGPSGRLSEKNGPGGYKEKQLWDG